MMRQINNSTADTIVVYVEGENPRTMPGSGFFMKKGTNYFGVTSQKLVHFYTEKARPAAGIFSDTSWASKYIHAQKEYVTAYDAIIKFLRENNVSVVTATDPRKLHQLIELRKKFKQWSAQKSWYANFLRAEKMQSLVDKDFTDRIRKEPMTHDVYVSIGGAHIPIYWNLYKERNCTLYFTGAEETPDMSFLGGITPWLFE